MCNCVRARQYNEIIRIVGAVLLAKLVTVVCNYVTMSYHQLPRTTLPSNA